MTLDWSKEIETTEDPPRPARVLATDGPCAKFPVIAVIGNAFHREFSVDGRQDEAAHVIPLRLRNVAPKPVRHEAWINLYSDRNIKGTVQNTEREADDIAREGRVECRRIVWNSDGSPVDDDPRGDVVDVEVLEKVEADRDRWKSKAEDLSIKLATITQNRDQCTFRSEKSDACAAYWIEQCKLWKAKANEALALLTQRNDAYEVLLRKTEALGVNNVEWKFNANVWREDRDKWKAKAEALQSEVDRAYQNAEPATSDSHEAVVDAEEDKYQSYTPVKNCTTCRWQNAYSVCGAKDCLGASQKFRGWESKHD